MGQFAPLPLSAECVSINTAQDAVGFLVLQIGCLLFITVLKTVSKSIGLLFFFFLFAKYKHFCNDAL